MAGRCGRPAANPPRPPSLTHQCELQRSRWLLHARDAATDADAHASATQRANCDGIIAHSTSCTPAHAPAHGYGGALDDADARGKGGSNKGPACDTAIKQLTGSKAGGHGGASAGNIALHPRLLVQRILP